VDRQDGGAAAFLLDRYAALRFQHTTPPIRTASQMVMMEAFHPYFEYVSVSICGIPQITLYGTSKTGAAFARGLKGWRIPIELVD